MRGIFLRLFPIVFLIVGCEFDDDSLFYPETEKGVFLMQSLENMPTSLMAVVNDSLIQNWEEDLGIESGMIGDMAGSEETLWITAPEKGEVYAVNAFDNRITDVLSFTDFSPHFISIGTSHLLFSDSTRNQIGFWNKDTRSFVKMLVNHPPQMSVYRSRKFFVQLGNHQVGIYQEEALAMIDTVNFDQEIEYLELDNRHSTVVYTRQDSQLYEALIDYNNNAVDKLEMEVTAQKVRHSPYLSQVYGKELTRPVELINGRISAAGATNAQDFEVDFLDGKVYYRKLDSLYVYEAPTRKKTNMGGLGANFQKAYFFVGKMAE